MCTAGDLPPSKSPLTGLVAQDQARIVLWADSTKKADHDPAAGEEPLRASQTVNDASLGIKAGLEPRALEAGDHEESPDADAQPHAHPAAGDVAESREVGSSSFFVRLA